MKTEKMNFKNIKDLLNRDEMKKIIAGSGGGYGCCNVRCGDGRTAWACGTGQQLYYYCLPYPGATYDCVWSF